MGDWHVSDNTYEPMTSTNFGVDLGIKVERDLLYKLQRACSVQVNDSCDHSILLAMH